MVECSTDEFVAQMDETGYDKVFITMPKMYSWNEKKMAIDFTVDEIYDSIKKYPDRLIGMAPYNPLKINESLKDIDKAVKDYGFKGVYVHTYGYGISPDDKLMYPLYAKCVELDIPISLQVGHSLERLPSEPGRPIYLDEVAMYFPELTIIASHTGWPWCEEMVAMAWKHHNIYIDISAHLPKYLDPTIINFMTTRGQNKTMFGTNGLGLKRCKEQLMERPMKKEEIRKKILRDNAVKIFKL